MNFAMSFLAVGNPATFWMPEQASTFAPAVDALFYFIYWLCVIFFVLIIGATGYLAWKYRKRSDDDRTSPIRGNHKLELVWSLVPSVFLLVMFAWGFVGFMDQQIPPDDAMEVHITGQKWSWSMTYENGGQDGNHLVVPVNEPVKLIMSSVDVLHSFFVPAFRIKRDVIPNRYTTLWFEATQEGTFDIFCTEYCGANHSEMIGLVDVVSREEYEAYLETLQGCAEGESLADCGSRVFTQKGCNSCHSIDGSRVIGPTFSGLWGSERAFTDGTSQVADENYVRQSIMDPGGQIVEGYQAQMPTFAGRIDDEELNALMAYIQSLAE